MDRVLTDFVKTLRNANIQVSPAETLDAMEVIEKVGYNNKELLKNTLSFTLPKTFEEKEKFNSCFEDFFDDQLSHQNELTEEISQPSGQINSDLGHQLLEDNQADIQLSISKAAKKAEIREIKYFTQRSVFSRRILDIMGVNSLEEELSQLGQSNGNELPTNLEQQFFGFAEIRICDFSPNNSFYVRIFFFRHFYIT